MQTKLYNALCARYGKVAVDAALRKKNCEWVDDVGLIAFGSIHDFANDVCHGDEHFFTLPDPVAVIVLCDVATSPSFLNSGWSLVAT